MYFKNRYLHNIVMGGLKKIVKMQVKNIDLSFFVDIYVG